MCVCGSRNVCARSACVCVSHRVVSLVIPSVSVSLRYCVFETLHSLFISLGYHLL